MTSTLLDDRLASDLDTLWRDGFLLIPQALSQADTQLIRARIMHARDQGWQDGLNDEGNMWFDSLLERDPEHFSRLVGASRVRPYLEALFGAQCQLRSMRAHINPGAYGQTWHMDFISYWRERRRAQGHALAVPASGVNTTFYFDHHAPGRAALCFVTGSHREQPPHTDPPDTAAIHAWAETRPCTTIHPGAGDCVLFLSHIVHRGIKRDQALQRSNVVCHYQGCAMHEGIWHVAQPGTYPGAFPFAQA